MIMTPLCTKARGLNFAALCWQWWNSQIKEMFPSKTKIKPSTKYIFKKINAIGCRGPILTQIFTGFLDVFHTKYKARSIYPIFTIHALYSGKFTQGMYLYIYMLLYLTNQFVFIYSKICSNQTSICTVCKFNTLYFPRLPFFISRLMY